MITAVMPVLFALFVWWLSTGVVLYVVGRPRRTHAGAMAVTSIVLLLGLYGLYFSARNETVSGAYVAFASALAVWGWHEMSFLLGYITGPRTTAAPVKTDGTDGSAPLLASIEVVIYHEFAIAVTVAVIYVLTAGGSNAVGFWTFVILWLARLSTKFNIYLGVPNHTEQFLPNHLKYLASYFCRKPMNLLFPISVTAATIVTVLLIADASAAGALPHEAAGAAFLATLMALAVLEHWFLVLPMPSAELWTWGLASRKHEARDARSDALQIQPHEREFEALTGSLSVSGANA